MHAGSMDNPTYDEAINVTININHVDDELEVQNHPYSEIGPNPAAQSAYEGLSESTMVSDHLYECIQNSGAQGALEDNNTMNGESTSEAVNDVPPNADNDYDGASYSAQGPIDST